MERGDFRPIACSDVLYKTISKVLSNELQEIMNGLVSKNQTNFINGRQISNSILLAHELVRDFSSKVGAARGSGLKEGL